jgi:hypothetical protein
LDERKEIVAWYLAFPNLKCDFFSAFLSLKWNNKIIFDFQTTNLTTESVMNVIVESGLNAASIVALYGCDRYYIEASMVHQVSKPHDVIYCFFFFFFFDFNNS